jgi:hypothetical protein
MYTARRSTYEHLMTKVNWPGSPIGLSKYVAELWEEFVIECASGYSDEAAPGGSLDAMNEHEYEGVDENPSE